MNEYISREELIDKLKIWLVELEADKNKGYSDELYENKGARESVECCIAEIETLPAANVQPVKHGRCVIDNEGYERCSVCNKHETGMRYFTFCPRCGAKLKGDTE